MAFRSLNTAEDTDGVQRCVGRHPLEQPISTLLKPSCLLVLQFTDVRANNIADVRANNIADVMYSTVP